MQDREQSEFNMAVSYLNRLNALFYIADEAAMQLDAAQWFHSLLALERELSTEMKGNELQEIEKQINNIVPEINYWTQDKNKGAGNHIEAKLYQQLHQLEIQIRTILKKSGLQNKMQEDALGSFK